MKEFQFTRPRGARPRARRAQRQQRRVSIHAPTGGATVKGVCQGEKMQVSIHAPTGGATFFRAVMSRHYTVSIHAPTGGATTAAAKKVR